jgi:hypothetical protein
MSNRVANRRARTKLPLALAFLAIVIVYLLSMPTQFIVGDSASEIGVAASSNPGARSSHLLTTYFYARILQLSAILGIDERQFLLVQIVNIVIGACCAIILYKVLTLLGTSENLSLALSIVFAISNGTWIHSINAETGIHPQLLWILSIYFWARCITLARAHIVFFALALVAVSVSTLLALNMVLLIPAIVLTLFIDQMHKPNVSPIRMLVTSGIIFVVLLAIPFGIGAYSEGIRSAHGVLDWVFVHPESVRLAQLRHFGTESLLRAVSGAISVLVDAKGGLTIVKLALRKEPLRGTNMQSYLGLALGCLVLLLVTVGSLKTMLARRNKHVSMLSCLGLLAVFFFSTRWIGSDPQFWLPCLPLFILMMAPSLETHHLKSSLKSAYSVTWATVLVILLLANLPRELPSIIFPRGGPDLRSAREFADHIERGDVVFTPGFSWVYLIDRAAKGVNKVNLVYDNLGKGEQFLVNIDTTTQEALRLERKVYFDGIEGARFASQYGAWQMVESLRGISREQLLKYLLDRYNVEQVADSPEGRMSAVTNKTGHGKL